MPAEKRPHNQPLQEPNLNELFKKELNDALKQVPAIKRNDEEMQSLPKLERNDLDDIGWPGALFQWRHYLKYWDKTELPNPKRHDPGLRVLAIQRSCGHTVCATCMMQFKAQEFPFHWACHQCRTLSDRVLTNWSLMQLIRENDDEDRGEDDENIEQNDEDSEEDNEDSDEDDYLNVLRVQMDPF
ncbi:hypothetical protein CAEBREN_22550 [Caenorhabditis brenneri]|uniref:RING-type domain-containing protein n=1 Tax=Caenorhabditis brenneri TaxID=135651 RepID=G0NV33_CAEBE|nr:hypothetical protein CAEBREN_22550 [Caenorhabditis brenneri]